MGESLRRQPSGARRVASATNRPTDEEIMGWEGAKVGKFEGKSAASRFSIKNEGFLIDGDRFMMAGIRRSVVSWLLAGKRKAKKKKRPKD